MIKKDYGRVDYKPRLKKWRAIYYGGCFGQHDVKLGDYDTQQESIKVLQDKIKKSK